MSFTPFDYGLTRVSRLYHQDWRHGGTASDVLATYLWDGQDVEAVVALRRDALLVRRGLENGEFEALWAACTGQPFGFAGEVPSGSAWVETILGLCNSWLAGHDVADVPDPWQEEVPASDALESEVSQVQGVLAELRSEAVAAEVAAALLRCVRSCPADLPLRFLLRVVGENGVVLSTEQYGRLARLGEKLGLGEYVVSDVEYLVR